MKNIRRPTLVEIAGRAGVHVSTASRVLTWPLDTFSPMRSSQRSLVLLRSLDIVAILLLRARVDKDLE